MLLLNAPVLRDTDLELAHPGNAVHGGPGHAAQGHIMDSRVSLPVFAFVPLASLQRYVIWSFLKGTSVQSDPSSLAP